MTEFDLIRKRFESLSPRQRDIALRLADGLTNVEIAEQLGVTVHTVKAHRAEVMRRMEASSFAGLVGQLQRLQSAHTTTELSRPTRAGPLRIVVVEDDPWYREYLTDNLNEHDFSAVGVANASDFKAAWAEQPSDIVILDIELGSSEEDGLSIAAQLAAHSACGIVMVTARGEADDRIKGLSVGADAYFSKPVNISELAITIANLGRRLRSA